MATNLNLSECTVEFIAEDHPEYPNRLNFINGTLTHPTLGEFATVECIQMTRRMSFKNNDDFFLIMDDEGQELQEFAVAIFDTASNVHPWLVDGGPRSGSGCWGSELSVGDMLYITELKVKDEVCSLLFAYSEAIFILRLSSDVEELARGFSRSW